MDILGSQKKRTRQFNKGATRARASRPASVIGFLKDETSSDEEFYFMDFSKLAAHITWRVAHFIDDAKLGRGRSFNELKDYLFGTGLQVSIRETQDSNGNARKALFFTDVSSFGFALRDTQICDQLALETLAKHVTDIPDETPSTSTRASLVPEVEDQERPTWFYAPSPAERGENDKVLVAALSEQGIYGVFKPKNLGDADPYKCPMGMKMVSRVKKDGSFVDAPYSKTYTPIKTSPNMYTLETNSAARTMKFETISGHSLEGFLGSIYDDGCFTVHGKSVFADRTFYGRRIKDSKLIKVQQQGDKAYSPYVPSGVDKAFLHNYLPKKYGDNASKMKGLLNTAVFTTLELGNILPQQRTVFAIDIDDLEVPEDLVGEIDFINNQQESIAWLREKLPEAMQDAKLVLMLSSSHGMAKDSGTVTYLGRGGDKVSLRVWVQADKPIDCQDFQRLIWHHISGMAADTLLYSDNQPIYGNPRFDGCDDPLSGKRTIVVPGAPTFDVDMLAEEAEALDQERNIVRPVAGRSGAGGNQPGQRSYQRPVKKIVVNPDDGLNDQSRARVLEKLTSLGDTELMEAYTRGRGHFDAVRNVINGHIYAVYDLYPTLPPISQNDLVQTTRDDELMDEVDFLKEAITEAFFNAAENPSRTTDMTVLHRYGVGENGLVINGKVAGLLESTTNRVWTAKKVEHTKTLKTILDTAKAGGELDRQMANEYLEKYTHPTAANKSNFALKADLFNGYRVLFNIEGIFIDHPEINDIDSKFATYSGMDRFFWASVTNSSKIPSQWKQGSLDHIFMKLADPEAAQNMVFCHNCELADIEHLLPKPASQRALPRPRIRNPLKPRTVASEGVSESKAPESDKKADLKVVPREDRPKKIIRRLNI